LIALKRNYEHGLSDILCVFVKFTHIYILCAVHSVPVRVIIGKQSPLKSKTEIVALAQIPYIQVEYMSVLLGMQEEYVMVLAEAITSVL
jgi:hypothetical protein